MTWKQQLGEFIGEAPFASHKDPHEQGGVYIIHLVPRPTYCDRGDWIIHLDWEGTDSRIDDADGFPRYFFGSEEEVKKQMETWVSRRSECRL